MSKKKIVVPGGMLKAAMGETHRPDGNDAFVCGILEAALRWLAENPIVPSDEDIESMREEAALARHFAVEWQRRMFLAPEPEVLEEIKDLLWDEALADDAGPRWKINEGVIEAYRRGQEQRCK
jgi:hypothetical protein